LNEYHPKITVYVAGKWSEREKARKVMKELNDRGYAIAVDWTTHEHPDMFKEYVLEDIEAIKSSDILLACMWNKNIFYKGAWIEIGVALGLDKKIIIIGEEVSGIFLSHPNISIAKDLETAIEKIDDYHCSQPSIIEGSPFARIVVSAPRALRPRSERAVESVTVRCQASEELRRWSPSDDPAAIPCERERREIDGSECSGRGSVLEL
jgi:hypothetical protein